jgi:plasmid maintenance system killer protein
LFATYWNEIEWIQASLAQIDKIDPDEIIICDGCFDPRVPNRSTDGTREIIQKYIASKSNARMISALRLSKISHAFQWLKRLPHEQGHLTLQKLRGLKSIWVNDNYRLNQAATFNFMISISDHFKPGSWMMTYDCDQFYSDDMLKEFTQLSKHSANILIGKELTFFESFNQFTDDYERRDYNNMPHRIFKDTRFIPTRHISRVYNGKYTNCSDFETEKRYTGNMYHYHVKSPDRIKAGYDLGDRKPPESQRTVTKLFEGEHPSIIREFFPNAI